MKIRTINSDPYVFVLNLVRSIKIEGGKILNVAFATLFTYCAPTTELASQET